MDGRGEEIFMGVKNILIVEGDELLRDTLGELLGLQNDFLITALETGEAAVAKLKEEHFDLLIMEEFLPGIWVFAGPSTILMSVCA